MTIAWLLLLSCGPRDADEIAVVPPGCDVVTSEPTAAAPLDALPTTFDIREAAVVPMEASTRWTTLIASLRVDDTTEALLLTRAPRDGSSVCPTVVRTPLLGTLSLTDGAPVFDVAGWMETDGDALVELRLGGEHIEGDVAREALWDLAGPALSALRPDLPRNEANELVADFYLRGDASGGQLGVVAHVFELDNDFRGPLLSGRWR